MPFVPLPRFQDRVGGRRAALAFAVRCFKRVEPLLAPLLVNGPPEVEDLLDAIDQADEVASTDKVFKFTGTQIFKRFLRRRKPPERSLIEIAVAVCEAADATDSDVGWARAIHSAVKAFEAAQAIGVDISSELREDLMRLDELERAMPYRDKPMAVDQSVFGPLWPNGYPRGWPLANAPVPTTFGAAPSAPGSARPASAGERA